MAQTADELLNSLQSSVPEHIHHMADVDPYFVINPETRQIETASIFPIVLMQFDHNSSVFTFELPRYIDGHDMMLCNKVRVHYNNIEAETGVENADVNELNDLRIDPSNPDKALCTWTITRNATQLAGILSFLVQYMCLDGDEVVYEFHSDFYEAVEIKPGRNNSEGLIIQYSDILTQWEQRLFGSGDSVIADIQTASQTEQDNIEAKGAQVRDSIPEEYTEVANMADEAMRRKADAIVISESGEVIQLDDSSDCNLLDLHIYGRSNQLSSTGAQLLSIEDLGTKTDRGLHQTIQGGVCTVRGTAITSAAFNLTLCGSYFATTPVFSLSPGTYTVRDCMIVSYDGTTQTKYQDTTFTLTETFDVTWVATRSYAINEVVNEITYPMLNLGSTALPWEPYTDMMVSPSPDYPQEIADVVNPTVSIYGGNLANIHGLELSANKSLSVSDDGYVVTATGGGDKAYVSSPTTLDVNVLKGKFIYFRANSVVSNNDAAKACAQLNIRVPTGTIYVAITSSDPGKEVYIPDDAIMLSMAVYTNNTGTALGEDCTVTIEGLGLYLRDMPWDEYKGTQILALSRELRGIPVTSGGNYTDSNGQQWICDEVDFKRGKFIQRVGTRVFDGSADEVWFDSPYVYNTIAFRTEISDSVDVGNVVGTDFLCDYFKARAMYDSDKQGAQHTMKQFYFRISKDLLSTEDITGFKTWLQSNPVTVQYVLATPIETDLTPAEIEAFRAFHTNATNTTILNNAKASMQVQYVADLERYIYKNVTIKERAFDLTLVEANWVESSDGRYFTQVINFDARPTGRINLDPTAEQHVRLILDGIAMFVKNENGTVTAYAIGGTPGADMIIRATETVVVYA